MSEHYSYPGQELAFFEKAVNWKSYFASYIKPYIGKKVLEVGSGIGATTRLLNDGAADEWTLLEPDEAMVNILKERLHQQPQFSNCTVLNKTVAELGTGSTFDTIIYIDVLEHIEDDKKEVEKASQILNSEGHLIILSPAYDFLFSPFDKAIGHYRRYTAPILKQIMPNDIQLVKLKYLDSAGFFASFANKLFLKQSYPTEKQIRMWDNYMIPLSRWTDKIFFHSFGKSILGIWRKK